MPDPNVVLALESRLMNAWPAFETQVCEGWLLRFAGGYSKRANAASPLVPGATLDDDAIDHVVGQYLSQRIRPTFRLTGLEGQEVDARLEARGFTLVEPTWTMTRDLTEAGEADGAVRIEPGVEKAWVRGAATAYGGDKADDAVLTQIVSRIRQKAAFATLSLDDKDVAWGLGVVERGYVGLYDIVVQPELRGVGLGRRIVASLMDWGFAQGASRAYLQVRETNAVARALYASLGFADAFRYTHRIRPGPGSGP